MIFMEAQLDDALDYIRKSNDYYLKNYHGKSSALADPQFAVAYIRYLLSKNIEVPPEFELALFKNRSLDYAKRYIELLAQYGKEPSKSFTDRISKTYLNAYLKDTIKKEAESETALSSFKVTLTPLINSDLPTLISEAIAISKRLDMDLDFMFHSTEINITPNSKYENIYHLISEKLSKFNK